MTKNSTSKVVALGGGTGTFTLLSGLKNIPAVDISAVVTMADDGGSNKVLRDEFGLLPTSGIRQAIVALSKDTSLLRQLFQYRYYQGTGISGMTFGNLFMAALSDIMGSQQLAIKETCELLGVQGHIYPVSYEKTSLVATYDDGSEVLGEHYIDLGSKQAKKRIVSLRSIPKIKMHREAKTAIEVADMIVLGPGDLYTNTIANLIVTGVSETIENSMAKLVFVMNLMSRPGETYNYKASDYLSDLSQYVSPKRIDYIIINSETSIPQAVLRKYKREGAIPVEDDLEESWHNATIIRAGLRGNSSASKDKGDKLNRSMVRHDPDLLAAELQKLLI